MSNGPQSIPSVLNVPPQRLPQSQYQLNAPTSHQNPSSVGASAHGGEQPNLDKVDPIQALLVLNSLRDSLNCILDNIAKSSVKQDELELDMDTLDVEQQAFIKKTDSKYLCEKANELNVKLSQLDAIINNLPQVTVTSNDFVPLLVDQSCQDEKSLSISKIINNYRGFQRLQEQLGMLNQLNPYNMQYKRYQVPYIEKKSEQFKQYKQVNKINDFERTLTQFMNTHGHNQPQNHIAVKVLQGQDKEMITTLKMPQNFEFVLHLIDYNIEKLHIRQVETRLMHATMNKNNEDHKQQEHKLLQVFERLEDLCLYAAIHFRHLYDQNSLNAFKQFLTWLKSYSNLFSAKCMRCEKHLVSGVPPLWRDLKTNDAYHEECKP